MPNFGLPLLLNWRLLRKTSYLKIKGQCGKVIYNLLETELDKRKNRATLAAIRSVSDHRQPREQPPRHAPGNGINSAPAQFLTCIGAERISDKQGVIAVLCQRGKGCNPGNFIDFYQFLLRYAHNVHSHIAGNESDSGFSGRTHKFR